MAVDFFVNHNEVSTFLVLASCSAHVACHYTISSEFLHLQTPHFRPNLIQVLDYWRKSTTGTKKHQKLHLFHKLWEENRRGKSPFYYGKNHHVSPSFGQVNITIFSPFFYRSKVTLTWQNLRNYERLLRGQVNFLSCCPWDMGSVPGRPKWWRKNSRNHRETIHVTMVTLAGNWWFGRWLYAFQLVVLCLVGGTPPKFEIDTKHDGFFKCIYLLSNMAVLGISSIFHCCFLDE